MFEIRGIDHVLLRVKSLERALPFYEQVLGCTVLHRLPAYKMVELRAGVSQIDLLEKEPTGTNADHVCLNVRGDVADVRDLLVQHAVAITGERDEGESYSLYVHDPSGNQLELKISRT